MFFRKDSYIRSLEETVTSQRRRLSVLECELAKRRADDIAASRALGVSNPEPGTEEARELAKVRQQALAV